MELSSLAQLERSHRRHDEVIAELLEVARRIAAGRPDDGDLQRVREAVAYFDRSVTRHFLDEEGSVFPRLSTRRPDLAPDLAALSSEHPPQIELQQAVAAVARELDGESRPAQGKQLLDAATRLADAHRAHVAREDQLFRAAYEALTAEDDAEIVAEMETRRDRDNGRPGAGTGRGGGGGAGKRSGRRHPRALTIPGHLTAMAKAAKSIKRTGKPATARKKAVAKSAAKKPVAKKPARRRKSVR